MPNVSGRGALYDRTLSLLKNCPDPLPDIAIAAKLPYYWLKKFSSGTIKDPSVNRVEKLYEYLAKRKLEV